MAGFKASVDRPAYLLLQEGALVISLRNPNARGQALYLEVGHEARIITDGWLTPGSLWSVPASIIGYCEGPEGLYFDVSTRLDNAFEFRTVPVPKHVVALSRL